MKAVKLSKGLLFDEPERKWSEWFRSLFKLSITTGSVSAFFWILSWLFTQEFETKSMFRIVITFSIGSVAGTFFLMGRYFHQRNKELTSYLITMAEKHKFSEEQGAKYEMLFTEAQMKNHELEELVMTIRREMNALIMTMTLEKQRQFAKERIILKQQEASMHANRRCQ